MKPKYNLKSDLIKSSFIIVAWLYIGTWMVGAFLWRGYIPLIPAWGWTVNAVDHHGKSVSGKPYRLGLDDEPSFVRVGDAWFQMPTSMHVTEMGTPIRFPYLSVTMDDGVTDEDIQSGREIFYHPTTNLFISRVDDTVTFSNDVFSVSVSKKKRNKESVVEKP